jgi:glycosyltransferase involved in cell wall biosynthesis
MKILFVSLFLPHPEAGHAGGRYVFELLKRLSSRHELTLATRVELSEAKKLDDLRPFCREIHPYFYETSSTRGVTEIGRLILNYLGFSRFADRLIAAGCHDLVQVEWVETAFLIRRHGTPMVLNAHDVMTKPFQRRVGQVQGGARIVARVVAAAAKMVELSIMRRFDRIMTMSEYDRRFLQQLWPDAPAVAVPIPAGMDLTERHFDRQPDSILFLASFKYRPLNVTAALWFYRQVFPLIRRAVPQARFIIAGSGPPAELQALAADPAVTVTGFVSDLDRCHKEAAVFVAPILTGGGIIVKVLDALAAGTPTVTTTFGNEGVAAVPGRDLLVADGAEPFATAVVTLLLDRSFAMAMGENGRSYVQKQFGLDSLLLKLDTVYREMTKK